MIGGSRLFAGTRDTGGAASDTRYSDLLSVVRFESTLLTASLSVDFPNAAPFLGFQNRRAFFIDVRYGLRHHNVIHINDMTYI